MHWHVAVNTEHDLVIIFIVTAATDRTACVILCELDSLLKCKIFDVSLKFLPLGNVGSILVRLLDHIELVHLVHDLSVAQLVSSLLGELKLFQEVCL